MSEYLDQIHLYFEEVPLWPFALLFVLGIIGAGVDVVNRKRRADAIDNFIYTIETEFSGMYPKTVNWPENIDTYLGERLPEMQANFETLRIFLPQKQLSQYNIDWNNYCDFCRNISDEKCNAENISESEPDPRETFKTLISELLKYTDKLKK